MSTQVLRIKQIAEEDTMGATSGAGTAYYIGVHR